jgi:hypothetical protein
MEARADASGLNVAIGYAVQGDQLLHRRWFCPNGGLLALESMNGSDMQTSGDCEHRDVGDIGLDSDTLSGVLSWTGLTVGAGGAVVGARGGGGGRHLGIPESIEADTVPSELVDEESFGGRFLRGGLN